MQPSKIPGVDDSTLIHKMFEVQSRQTTLILANDGLKALQCPGTQGDIAFQ